MRSTFLLLLLFFPAYSALHAQSQDLEAFSEVIDVRVLNLEVAVTDKNDQPVSGLQPEDFRLFIDGRETAIEFFSEIHQGSANTHAGISAVPTVTPGEVVGTSFLLFVDNFFGIARDRKVVLTKILDTLPELGPKDQMAVVSFDGRQLDLVGGWSTSPETIAENLRAAMDQPAFGLQRLGEVNLYESQRNTATGAVIRGSTTNILSDYIRKLGQQVRTVVQAATTAMRTMSNPPGRKVLLLMSGGWPDDPTTYAAGTRTVGVRQLTRSFSPKQAFKNLASTANLLGYTIYPIDMPGKMSFGPRQQTQFGSGEFDRTTGRENALEIPLLVLAEETGGRAMINGLRETALPRTLKDTSSYYWLGYTPQWKRNDTEHEVRVEVLRPNLKSRSRQAFRDLSRRAEVTMLVESNLLFSTPLSDVSLEVDIGRPKKAGRGKLELPISLKIPLDNIVMLPGTGGFAASLELRVAVIDSKGDRSEIPVIPVAIGGATKPPPGAHAIYDTSLKLRKIEQRLALALYDLVGEKVLSTSIDFDPASI